MIGNIKTVKGQIQQKVYAVVCESEYENLKREIPDLFFNPNIVVDIVPDEKFDRMIQERENESS